MAGLVFSAPAFATNTVKNNNGKGNGSGENAKVTICHATNSQTKPYVVETVSTSSIDEQNNKLLNGHGDHTGGVWYQGIAAHSWGDIIPAFTSPKGAKYAGQNMNEAGKTTLNNGCKSKTAPVKNNDDKGKPVHAVDTDKKDNGKGNDVKVVSAKDTSSVVTELPRTGIAGAAGFVGTLGVSAYALTRRFMK